MTIFQALFLAIIQSLCEFLPISSSAHLTLAPWIFDFKTPGQSFDIALHFATSIAVIYFFRKDFYLIIRGFLSLFFKKIESDSFYQRLSILMLVSLIPIFIFAPIIKDPIESIIKNPVIIAIFLIFFGIVLYFVDKVSRSQKDLYDLTKKQAFVIGLAQLLAIGPGVSRSGITITTGRLYHLNRETAARFSFLISTPAILGATLLEAKNIVKISHNASGFSAAFFIGFFATIFLSYLTIKYFLKFISTHNFKSFMFYRIILGLVIIVFSVLK